MSNRKTITLCAVLTVALYSMLHSQELVQEKPGADIPVEIIVPAEEDGTKSKSVNVNAKILYGLYNSIFSSFSILQSVGDFTYQLNSDLKRADDFGYKNSGFYNSETGFSGKADLSETWKLMPDLLIKNGSRGLFENTAYRREENDTFIGGLKMEYKPTPSRWDVNIGGGCFEHRLEKAHMPDINRSRVYRENIETGWEYVWSSSNKVRCDLKGSYYTYDVKGADDDIYSYAGVLLSFKITENIMIGLGPSLFWDRDFRDMHGFMPSGKINFSTVGLKYSSFELSYSYDLDPFKPEIFYVDQKYMAPPHDLPPSRVHHCEIRAGYDYLITKTKQIYMEGFKVKFAGVFENRDRYYNLYSDTDNLLRAQTLSATFLKFRGDAGIRFRILTVRCGLGANYEYSYFRADRHITYVPEHSIGITADVGTEKWGIEYDNTYKGEVYVNPLTNIKMGSMILGMIQFQYRILESFFLIAKVDNCYDEKFSYRFGYPEAGRVYAAGIKITI